MTRRIGLIVNPIAGMGGAVGLKGTDGPAMLERAQALGAEPRAESRATIALRRLARLRVRSELVTGPWTMGETSARAAGLTPEILALAPSPRTTAMDTRRAAEALRLAGVELIAFAGGDGTARDVHAVIGTSVPLLGIPAGVKMRSAVFASTPVRAGEILAAWVEADLGSMPLREAEIVDVEPDDLTAGRSNSRLYGAVLVPAPAGLVPAAKSSPRVVDTVALSGLADELATTMEPGRVYLFGPGVTTQRILHALGIRDGTLLGVDAVQDGRLIGRDLGEAAILAILDRHPATIVAGVIGGQGFLFGRGNQPLSARVLARVGRERILVVAGLEKLAALDPLRLVVDTGDAAVDAMLSGWMRVRTAPGRSTLVRVGG